MVGAAPSLSRPLRPGISRMKRKPMTWPLSWATRSAAALAEPPGGQVSIWSNQVKQSGSNTGGNDVVDDENLLALFDGVLLHLEKVLAVLLDVLGGDARTGKLALLADSGKGDAEAQSEARAKEEAASIEADNDVGLDVGKVLEDLELESVDEGGMGFGVGEEWHDIDKVNAGDGKVRELAQVVAKNYLCTGELGGGGGGGGGLSSRGILGGCGITHCKLEVETKAGSVGTEKMKDGAGRGRELEHKPRLRW